MRRRRALSSVVASVLGGLALWAGGGPAAGQVVSLGMRPVDASTSAVVRERADSVVSIISFGAADRGEPVRMITRSIPLLRPGALTFPLAVEDREAFQGEVCRLNGLAVCPVFREEVRGTGFSVGEGGRFITCRHAVQDWMYWAYILNRKDVSDFSSIVPAMLIGGRDGRLLFATSQPEAGRFRKTLFARSEKLVRPMADLLKTDLFWDADFMEFMLPSDLGVPPLPPGPLPRLGEPVFVIGFPNVSSDAAAVPRQMTAQGVVETREALSVTTSAPSGPGVSGGPVLDGSGVAVAMTCATSRVDGRRVAVGLPIDRMELADRLFERHRIPLGRTGP